MNWGIYEKLHSIYPFKYRNKRRRLRTNAQMVNYWQESVLTANPAERKSKLLVETKSINPGSKLPSFFKLFRKKFADFVFGKQLLPPPDVTKIEKIITKPYDEEKLGAIKRPSSLWHSGFLGRIQHTAANIFEWEYTKPAWKWGQLKGNELELYYEQFIDISI